MNFKTLEEAKEYTTKPREGVICPLSQKPCHSNCGWFQCGQTRPNYISGELEYKGFPGYCAMRDLGRLE